MTAVVGSQISCRILTADVGSPSDTTPVVRQPRSQARRFPPIKASRRTDDTDVRIQRPTRRETAGEAAGHERGVRHERREPTAVDPADIAAMRADGSLHEFLQFLTGKAPAKPKPPVEEKPPAYHIARPGAWPCGTAPTGPTPGPCCPDCQTQPEGSR